MIKKENYKAKAAMALLALDWEPREVAAVLGYTARTIQRIRRDAGHSAPAPMSRRAKPPGEMEG